MGQRASQAALFQPPVAQANTERKLKPISLHNRYAKSLIRRLSECSNHDPNRGRPNGTGKWRTVNVPAALWDEIIDLATTMKEPQ